MSTDRKIKVIFLDIDGVLDSEESWEFQTAKGNKRFHDIPDEGHIRWLNKIVRETGAKIVLSSSWRKITSLHIFAMLMHCQGFKGDIISKTPSLSKGERGDEIKHWLDVEAGNIEDTEHQLWSRKPWDVESFVVLDDDSDMSAVWDNFVKCSFDKGLGKEEAEKAIEILNRGNNA